MKKYLATFTKPKPLICQTPLRCLTNLILQMKKIIHLQEIGSTNTFAQNYLRKNKGKDICGTVFFTGYQTAGRGTGKNFWESQANQNLLFSLILCPDFIEPVEQFLLSKAVSLGILRYFLEKNIQAKIKWPNDIYVSDKKIAGILIENSILDSKISNSIVGIGLNVNQEKFDFSDKIPISLFQITQKKYDLNTELNLLLKAIFEFYDFLKQNNNDEISNMYFSNLYKNGEFLKYKTPSENYFYAKIHSIDAFGRLVLQTENNDILSFSFKEIELET